MGSGVFDRNGADFARNITAYHRHARDNDLFLSYAILPPQGARKPDLYQSEDKTPPTLRVTAEDADGVVLNGERVQKLEGHRDLVDRCFLFDDDKLLLSASWDKYCRVWDLETGNCLRTLEGDSAKMRGCAVYKEGKTLRAVGAGSGGDLCVWDLDLDEQEDVQQAHDDGRSLSDIAGDPVADFLAGLSNDHRHGRETPASTPPTPPLSTSEDGAASDDDVVAEYLRAAGVAYD